MTTSPRTQPDDLRADCAACFGLCCVTLPFTRSSDFALTKPAGRPCLNLADDHRCGIHSGLRERGFTGCTVYECLGAGQKLSRHTFGGRDWRAHPELLPVMTAAYPVMRHLHELLWHLHHAAALPPAAPVRDRVTGMIATLDDLTHQDSDTLLAADLPALHAQAAELLRTASRLTRRHANPRARDHARADLTGRDMRNADLRAADLRGALLIGADLTGATLTHADLLGADLRAAVLSGADLSTALFLTQPQLNAARGDAATRLPDDLTRPPHWH
ncbi:pentapeptide repeat-containing protein [Actinomadura harenae]|uniref:Pentapeptide repeat-containing protein n=1 Tax=Actinomadura harenae TaxID=2483351 RepID=A0A3M2M0Y9_9ACTN|nr:pentapeptide repeat-containing protein [Actinomadura harenae]RMI43277.1 pentapeptide repeat-containing protein [Actinomadura harenae]